jgi:hypothetical protein
MLRQFGMAAALLPNQQFVGWLFGDVKKGLIHVRGVFCPFQEAKGPEALWKLSDAEDKDWKGVLENNGMQALGFITAGNAGYHAEAQHAMWGTQA